MVSKCANPGCDTRLHYFREGRLYQFETRSETTDTRRADARGGASVRHVRNYWLCGPCSARLALTFTPEKGVEVIPLSLASHLNHACAGVPLD
jgi:hypothetical protein